VVRVGGCDRERQFDRRGLRVSGPLDGLRVLDLTRLLPGGYATLLLADLGADILKVEEPGKGDYVRWTPPMVGEFSAAHVALNRNKRSLTLNLKSEEGRSILGSLVESHDVLVESFRPGVMARLGVGWDDLRPRNPRLVYCAISGYGQDGPRSQTAGHDINYIGYAGVLGIVGDEGEPPVIPGVQIGDLAGGGMAAVISILAALHRRAQTGRGDFCDVSMMDGVVSWLSIHAGEFVAGGVEPQRGRMHLSGAYPCYRIYPAADGWITVGALEPQFWSALCDAIDRPDLARDAFAVGDRRDEVVDELNALFATRTRGEWMKLFDDKDVCVAPVNDFTEAFADEQVRHRAMIVDGDVPGVGPWKHVGNPIKQASAPGDIARLPPPGLGEHSDAVLEELGIGDSERARLRSVGVI
jgi:crotonobetainyl-CoA:carnitine CoA-transferase CaiB-like acyl-CoA transferase